MMQVTPLSARERRRLRAIAHQLDPVVTVAEKGLTDGVLAEARRALIDHELIKARIQLEDRDDRRAVGDALCSQLNAELIQRIGKVLVLYRSNPEPKPKLSNVHRHG